MTVATDRSEENSQEKSAARHPLAPLTVAEAGGAARAALEAVGPESRLAYVALAEPPKEVVRGWDGAPLPRAALAVVYSKRERLTWMVTVSLADETVTAKVPVAGRAAVADARRVDRRRRAVQGGSRLPGRAGPARDHRRVGRSRSTPGRPPTSASTSTRSGRRLARCVAYVLDGPRRNPYARPVENLVAVLDRDTGEVVELHRR